MAIQLRQHENVVYPIPYEEAMNPPLVITNQRVVRQRPRTPAAEELATSRIDFVGRHETRPLSGLGLVLALLGLPMIFIGGYLVVSVWGMEMAPPLDTAQALGQSLMSKLPKSLMKGGSHNTDEAPPETEPPPPAPPSEDDSGGSSTDGAREVLLARGSGIALAVLGILLAVIGLRLSRRRAYFVIVRAEANVWRLDVPDQSQQTQIMVTLQAVAGR
jgi:hypothetical protein